MSPCKEKRLTEPWTNRRRDRSRIWRMDRLKEWQMDHWRVQWMDQWREWWMDPWRKTDEGTDRWTDGQTHTYVKLRLMTENMLSEFAILAFIIVFEPALIHQIDVASCSIQIQKWGFLTAFLVPNSVDLICDALDPALALKQSLQHCLWFFVDSWL